MSATTTIRSPQASLAAGDLATLHGAVERLFKATDASSVVEICELMLGHFGIPGQLRWRRKDEQPALPAASYVDLAENPQGPRIDRKSVV